MQIRINHKTKTKASKRKDGTNLIAFGGGGGVAVGGGVRVSTATPWAVRAELPKAPDLSVDRSILRSGSSSSRRHDLIFVVNPSSANGRTGKEWKKLLPYLRSRLGADCNAIREGADAVIAVGGDGTLHEVVNGFFWAGKTVTNYDRDATHSTALGLIPLGTGSDFARIFGWLAHVFPVNEGEWEVYSQVTALCVGNAKYFGGGMKITPNADPRSGNFEVVILLDFKWYDFILKLRKLYNGMHLTMKNVSSRSVHSIEVMFNLTANI